MVNVTIQHSDPQKSEFDTNLIYFGHLTFGTLTNQLSDPQNYGIKIGLFGTFE